MFSSPTLIFVTDDSSLFHFIGKWNEQKEILWWNSNIYLRHKKKCRFGKEISKMVVWSENVFKGTCGCSFHCLRNFVDKRSLFGGHSMTLTHSSNRLLHKSVSTVFLIMSHSDFPAVLWQILKSHFERKQSKTDYPQKKKTASTVFWVFVIYISVRKNYRNPQMCWRAGAHKVENLARFFSSFDPYFHNIQRVRKRCKIYIESIGIYWKNIKSIKSMDVTTLESNALPFHFSWRVLWDLIIQFRYMIQLNDKNI